MSIAPVPPAAKAHPKIDGIQLLRALAAIVVTGFHLNGSLVDTYGYDGILGVFEHGEMGVDLFFVISGFIILYTVRRRPTMGVRDFLQARLLRIYPIYWLILLAYIFLAAVAAMTSLTVGYQADPLTILSSALLFPFPRDIIIIAWTLKVEILFYGLFALTYFALGLRGFFISLGVWALLAQAFKIAGVSSDWTAITFYSGNIEFLYGAGLALVFEKGRLPRSNAALVIGVIGILIVLAGHANIWGPFSGREFAAGIPCALVLYGVLGANMSLPRWATLLGDASYVLYLGHLLGISVAFRLLEPFIQHSDMMATFIGVAILIASLVASVAAFLFIERPFQVWYKGRLAKQAPPDNSA